MNGYELSRNWFDWCYENPEKINPNHGVLYFFIIEHCNKMGWAEKFGLPTDMAKTAIGIRSYNTYINTLNDLISWGFVIMIEKSRNQYTCNIIALSNFNKATTKAIDKATLNHIQKQHEITSESISSIIKQETSKPLNNQTINEILEGQIERAKKMFLELTESINWMNLTCKFLIIPYEDVNKCYDYLKKLLHDFFKRELAGMDLNRQNDVIIKHFINWAKIQIDNDAKIIKHRNVYKK